MKVCDICGLEASFDLKWYGQLPDQRDKSEELVGHFCNVHLRELEDFIAKEKKVWEVKK